MSSLEKVFYCLGAAPGNHIEFLSREMIKFARVSIIIVQMLPESTRTFAAVFPNTTVRIIDSVGVVGSSEDTDATQLSSSDE